MIKRKDPAYIPVTNQSAGVSCVIPNKTLNQASLIKNTDDAMYLVKDSGVIA